MPLTASVLIAVLALRASDRTPPTIERSEASAGQQVTLRVGQQLRVSLPENVTTGYSWQLDPACGTSLHLETDQTAPPATALAGAGRTRAWLFTASAAGSCNLRFRYARPWEKNKPGKVVAYPLTVKPR